MKTNVKCIFFLGLLMGLAACQAPSKEGQLGSGRSGNGTDVQNTGSNKVVVSYQKPENLRDPWTRVLQLKGANNLNQRAVDMQFEGDLNWTVVGITNESGVYYHLKSDKKVRYRIAGVFETDWLEPLMTTFITSKTDFSNALITGELCIVESNEKVYLEDKSLTLECNEVIIDGYLYSFKEPFHYLFEDRRSRDAKAGRNAGKLQIKTKSMVVRGQIILSGETGRGYTRRSHGRAPLTPNGGNGGEIIIHSETRLQAPSDAFIVDSGKPGPIIRTSNGAVFPRMIQGASGQRGSVFIYDGRE